MKKSIYIILSLFLFIPFIANAETLTYNVCESGCEYSSLSDVSTAINNISDLSDKDIVINVNSNISGRYAIGSSNKYPKSITFTANEYNLEDTYLYLYAKDNVIVKNIDSIKYLDIRNANSVLISDIMNIDQTLATENVNYLTINNINNLTAIGSYNPNKITINDSQIKGLKISFVESTESYKISYNEKNISDILEIDEKSFNNISMLRFAGNIVIENKDLSNILLSSLGGRINVYNCKIGKLLYLPDGDNITANIYNSQFNALKYKNVKDIEEFQSIYQNVFNEKDISKLHFDIYDINISEIRNTSNTTVYFDKEAKLKPNGKLNLVDYLDYYTEDKQIEYTIEDESIAKIENKELIGLKEGNTKVTVTTDEGHVVYRINLVVEKETIPEKIDKMTIKVPITGSMVKAWVVVVSAILLSVIGICSYMLIRRKK